MLVYKNYIKVTFQVV